MSEQRSNESDYKGAAEALWQLLDDISTLDDACKSNDAVFRKAVRTVAERRGDHAHSYDGQTLIWSWEEKCSAKGALQHTCERRVGHKGDHRAWPNGVKVGWSGGNDGKEA
jgi:hypothetical protein